jgi:hypothetical protein
MLRRRTDERRGPGVDTGQDRRRRELERALAFQLTQQFSEGTFDRFKQLKLKLNLKFAQYEICSPSDQLQLLQRLT